MFKLGINTNLIDYNISMKATNYYNGSSVGYVFLNVDTAYCRVVWQLCSEFADVDETDFVGTVLNFKN